MQVVLEKGEQHSGTRAVFLDIRTQVRRTMTAWLMALLGDDLTADLIEDLSVLIMAFTDGLLVGSQIYAEWEPEAYVELFLDAFAGIVETQRVSG